MNSTPDSIIYINMSKWYLLLLFAAICSYVGYMSGYPLRFNYVETQCTIENTGIGFQECSGDRCFDGSVMYVHHLRGETYNVWITRVPPTKDQMYISELLRETYPLGTKLRCYYNPLDPFDLYTA